MAALMLGDYGNFKHTMDFIYLTDEVAENIRHWQTVGQVST